MSITIILKSPYAILLFLKIHNKDYKYGCVSKLFTNESYELVSAHDLICSEKKRNDVSTYEQL